MILEMEMFGWINPPILETGGKLEGNWMNFGDVWMNKPTHFSICKEFG
jgi:hypothetical protein